MDKRIIITGASDGLGLETAKILLGKGYKVLNLSRNKPKLEGIDHIEMDLTDEKSIDNAAKQIHQNYPNFDALINCAGTVRKNKLDRVSFEDLQTVFGVNVFGPIVLTSKLMPLIKQNNADIVNVGSTVGFKAHEDQAAYCSSKWAVRGVNEYLQTELKDTSIRVIGFNPGGMKTQFFQKNLNEDYDATKYMDPKGIAQMLVSIIESPKYMEVSEIIINRKVKNIT